MRRLSVLLLSAALAGGALVAAQPQSDVLEAAVSPVGVPAVPETFPTRDASGTVVGETRWRVVTGTGNCCENYLAVTPDGRLLNYGGSYVHYSDDDGAGWWMVRPRVPEIGGEGALAVAPDGDVIGIGWDPYTGDQLQAIHYEADDDTWYWSEQPVHLPFYDRPWLAVVPGPVTQGLSEHPWVAVANGAWPSKQVLHYSTDGLTYTTAGAKSVDAQLNDPFSGPLPVAAYPEADFNQSHVEAAAYPIGDGYAVGRVDQFDLVAPCDRFLMRPDLTWTCLEGHAAMWQVADSNGDLHSVGWSPAGDLTYSHSTDGGETVEAQTLSLPDDYEVGGPADLDLKANGAVGIAAIAAYGRNADGIQHFVYELRRQADGRYRLDTIHEVGAGDLEFSSGVGASVRLDFASLAILPDGRVAVSFNDARRTRPAVAIELAD